MKEKEEYYCEVCGRKISKEEYETYGGICWESRALGRPNDRRM